MNSSIERPRRRRRCMLAVPASSERKIEKALQSGVDFVFLDLEDAVAPSAKPQARQNAIRAFNEMDWGGTVRCFRMNGIDSYWAIEDLLTVVSEAGNNIDTLIIPKVKQASDVKFVETMLELIEAEHGIERKIGFELLIEEVEAVQNIKELSEASDRVESLMFGVGDYTRAQGVDIRDVMLGDARHYTGDFYHYQRSALVVAARCRSIDFVDGPWGAIADLDGYRRECKKVKTLGAVGKWAVYPPQIEVAQEVFSPDEEELRNAFRMRKTYLEAKAQGLGAVKDPISGGMLDEAIMPIVNNIIGTAKFLGMDTSKYE